MFPIKLAQLFTNQSNEVSFNLVSGPPPAWVAPWTWRCWTWASKSTLFTLVTSRTSSPIFPPPTSFPAPLYVVLSVSYIVLLYSLFITPIPRTTRTKQLLAFPLLVALVLQPILFTCPVPIFHMTIAVSSIAVATRMVDLYYVQPWTGIPSLCCPVHLDETAKAKKDLNDKVQPLPRSLSNENFLNWNMARFQREMWAPLRKFSAKSQPKPSQGKSLRWQELALGSLACNALLDVNVYLLSFYTAEDLDAMELPQYALCMIGVGVFIMFHLLWIYVSIAMVFSLLTGKNVETTEWTMLGAKMPCFALNPAEFWTSWQTLFRYIWVDLAFLPTRRLCRKYLNRSVVGPVIAKAVEQALPVFAVFTLSGVLHAYIVYAVWREPIWSQFLYFWSQAVAVVLTKVIERSKLGVAIQENYRKGNRLVRMTLIGLAFSMMLFQHSLTLPFFMEPYKRHTMWLDVKERSLLWWIYGN